MDQVIKQRDGTTRMVGKTMNDVFIARRVEDKHMYRGGKIPLSQAINQGSAAWGLDAKNCVDLYKEGYRRVKIVSDKAVYECPLDYFLDEDKRFRRHFLPHGAQYFLNLRYFNITERVGV